MVAEGCSPLKHLFNAYYILGQRKQEIVEATEMTTPHPN